MESKQFKEYKAIIEESIRQAGLTESTTIQTSPLPNDTSIYLHTSRGRDCILMASGQEIRVLKRMPYVTTQGTYEFKVTDIVNLANPGSILQLGVAIKDLLNFSYWSKADDYR